MGSIFEIRHKHEKFLRIWSWWCVQIFAKSFWPVPRSASESPDLFGTISGILARRGGPKVNKTSPSSKNRCCVCLFVCLFVFRVKKLVQFREQLLTFPATEALRLASRERKRRRGKGGKGGKGAAPTKRQSKRSKRRARTLTDVTIILIDSMSR